MKTLGTRNPLARAALVLMLAFSLVMVACGDDDTGGTTTTGGSTEDPFTARGSAADAYDMYNGMTGQARQDALVAAAQEEGYVVFYTASSGMEPVIEAFEDTYDITVELYRGNADTVYQRLMQEFEAGFYGVDVFDDAEAYRIARDGLTYEYINPAVTDLIPGYDPATHVAATRLSVYTQAWNTDLVDEAELPDDIAGFATDEWCGRMSMDPRDWVWFVGVRDYYVEQEGWTDEEVDAMFAKLAECSRFDRGHTTQAQLLLAGEFDFSLTVYTQSIDRELEKDAEAPVAWKKSDGSWIKPLVFFPQGVTLMKNAPHPAAAMLFADWLLTEGQTILANEDRTPTAIAQPGGPLEGIPNEDLIQVSFDKYFDDETWATRFDNILTGG